MPRFLIQAGGWYWAYQHSQIPQIDQNPDDSDLYWVCSLCQDAREVDQFLEVYDPITKCFELENAERSFYLVKFKATSALHCVWLNFDQASASGKMRPFLKKLSEEGSDSDPASLLCVPESILAVHNKLPQNGWKYCLVKWEGQEYAASTWEKVSTLFEKFPGKGQSVWQEFLAQQKILYLASHDKAFRTNLLQGQNPGYSNALRIERRAQLYPY